AIAVAIQAAAKNQFRTVRTQTKALADEWGAAMRNPNSDYTIGNITKFALETKKKLREIEISSRAQINQNIATASATDSAALNNKGLEEVRFVGESKLGSSLACVAENSSVVADAQESFEIEYTPGSFVEQFL